MYGNQSSPFSRISSSKNFNADLIFIINNHLINYHRSESRNDENKTTTIIMLQRLKFCLVNILHDMNDSKLSRINLFIAQLDIKRVGGDKIGTIDLNFSEVLISEKLLLNFKGEERSQNYVLNCIVCFPVNSKLFFNNV